MTPTYAPNREQHTIIPARLLDPRPDAITEHEIYRWQVEQSVPGVRPLVTGGSPPPYPPCFCGGRASSPLPPRDKVVLLYRAAGSLAALAGHLAAHVPADMVARLEADADALREWAQELEAGGVSPIDADETEWRKAAAAQYEEIPMPEYATPTRIVPDIPGGTIDLESEPDEYGHGTLFATVWYDKSQLGLFQSQAAASTLAQLYLAAPALLAACRAALTWVESPTGNWTVETAPWGHQLRAAIARAEGTANA